MAVMTSVYTTSLYLLATFGVIASQATSLPSGACTYNFYVSGQQQCTDQEESVHRLQEEVNNLHVQEAKA